MANVAKALPAITVGELISILQGYDPKRVVVLASDAEGNDHRPLLTFYEVACSKPGPDRYVRIGLEKLTPADAREGHVQEDVIKKGKPALVLVPAH